MARDYKPRGAKRKGGANRKGGTSAGGRKKGRRSASSRRRDTAPGWQWLLSGLGTGLLVALGVFIVDRLPGGVVYERRVAATATPTPAAPSNAPTPAPSPATPPAEAVEEEDSPRDYAFYDLLPRFEVVIPEAQETGLDAPSERTAAVREPGTYILQAGSFRSLGDADRMQATLALQGIESRIQVVTIDDASFHRVRIGPIADLSRLEQLREQLRTIEVEPLVIRVATDG